MANKRMCHRCKKLVDENLLNKEAMVHHHAKNLECTDRKQCERNKRKGSYKALGIKNKYRTQEYNPAIVDDLF